ncbi:DUF4190 domain-containing protein [Nonomuraea sp. NN258]|uniref:DUF4190 domain-containing protein n=1 Tax=Nonomuraea antri TaxID=2730852 RepID=UPI00156918ED|nr:DUF4190 domain-containing protein [Nonomuraea antri]NRQ40298.1 DUF4190 domain-containing protein [Nonomuraea antri]
MTYSSGGYQGSSGKATAALVLGIVSLVLCGILSILTVIVGHSAIAEIDREGLEGRGLATAGLVLGYVAMVLWGIGLLIYASS